MARCSCEVINFEKIITSETSVQKFVNKFVCIFLIALVSKFVSIVPKRRLRRKEGFNRYSLFIATQIFSLIYLFELNLPIFHIDNNFSCGFTVKNKVQCIIYFW